MRGLFERSDVEQCVDCGAISEERGQWILTIDDSALGRLAKQLDRLVADGALTEDDKRAAQDIAIDAAWNAALMGYETFSVEIPRRTYRVTFPDKPNERMEGATMSVSVGFFKDWADGHSFGGWITAAPGAPQNVQAIQAPPLQPLDIRDGDDWEDAVADDGPMLLPAYPDYPLTDHFHLLKLERLTGQPCELNCGRVACVVHHTNYRHLGHERAEDTMSICFPCHDRIHGFLQRCRKDAIAAPIRRSAKAKIDA